MTILDLQTLPVEHEACAVVDVGGNSGLSVALCSLVNEAADLGGGNSTVSLLTCEL